MSPGDAAPALPLSCCWVNSLNEATEMLAAGQIPLLHPGDDQRAEGWARVMNWYNPAGLAISNDDPDGEASSAVVSTTSAEDLGRLAATALHRPHHHLDTLTNTTLLPTERSVLVVTPAADATLSALSPALSLWEEFGTQVGLLTGRDAAGMVFALAKILAKRISIRGTGFAQRVVVLDGRKAIAHHVDGDGSGLRLADALTDNWHTIVVDAHGGPTHAVLGTELVLCGLTGARERDLGGQSLVGGCTESHCKLAPHSTIAPVHPHDLRTTTLAFYVPNSLAIGRGERYPSDLSLILDALEGFPAAVLGLARGDVDTTTLDPTVTDHFLSPGTTFGEAAGGINAAMALRGLSTAALLLGDPVQCGLLGGSSVVSTPGTAENPVNTDRELAVPTSSAAFSPGIPGADVRTDVDDLAAILDAWPYRLAEAELVEGALCRAQARFSLPTHQSLEAMRVARTDALRLVTGTVGHLNRYLNHRTPDLPPNPTTTLNGLSERWSSLLTALLATGPNEVPESLTVALTTCHRSEPRRSAAAGPCDGCGAPCRRLRYSSTLPVGNRTEVHCPRCGTIRSHPDGGSAVLLDPPRQIHSAQTVGVSVMVDGAWNTPGVLSLQLRPDFPSPRATVVRTTVMEAGPTTEFLEVPNDTISDMYAIWAYYCCQFQIALARTRVPVVPMSATPATS